jgi:hypothetical protein
MRKRRNEEVRVTGGKKRMLRVQHQRMLEGA